MTDPLVITLYAGPGAGKSTTAAQVFAELKQAGRNVELVGEYAKDLTWEEAWGKLRHQPYIAAKQMWRLDRLRNQVEAVVTDTSTLLGLIYGDRSPESGMTPEFEDWIVADYARRRTLNIFLERDPRRGYNPKGRTQTAEEAKQADSRIKDLLDNLLIEYVSVPMDVTHNSHVDEITGLAHQRLRSDLLSSGMVPGGKD